MSGPLGSAQWMYASGAEVVQQSLKFNDDESQYLSWTPAAAGNQKTWTWSGWVKRANLSTSQIFFGVHDGGSQQCWLGWNSGDIIQFFSYQGSTIANVTTEAVFRDVSAWYHLVVSFDAANTTMNMYVNGVDQTLTFNTAISNTNHHINSSSYVHGLGRAGVLTGNYADMYLSDVYFIDGQALAPTSFGQFTNGYWEKKDYAGSYGTNGFHLTFEDDVVSEGFNAVTYRGNGGTQSISGLGFSPDLVWIKHRGSAYHHRLADTVRGATKHLYSSLTNAEGTDTTEVTGFGSDGFTVNSSLAVNEGGGSLVAWCWDAGSGSPVSNTDGTITSTVKANPDYGFSIVSYTGNGTAGATVGHGLSSTPELIIAKNRDAAEPWPVYHADLGATKGIYLNDTAAPYTLSLYWNDTAPTSSVFSVGGWTGINASGQAHIAYCFHSVAGYSSIGSYTGTGAAGNVVTTGFRPAFVMIKNTSTSGIYWTIYDNTREPANPKNKRLFPNVSNAEQVSSTVDEITFTDTGFELNSGQTANESGSTMIYMAFADTREAAFWKDVSGQGNHWTPNNLDYRDSLVDSPANNFAVLNPLAGNTSISLSEGNLKFTASAAAGNKQAGFGMSSGKWYWELFISSISSYQTHGITTNEFYATGYDENYGYASDGRKWISLIASAYGASYTAGDILGFALDMDAGTFVAYKNGVSQGTLTSGLTGTLFPFVRTDGTGSINANFGQDSTFAGAKPMGAFTDDNGIGNFQYAPPAGYLALCTANLPTPTIIDGSEHFNTVLYTGTGAAQSITGANHAPDLLWIKRRDAVNSHILYDSVRGDWELSSNSTGADISSAGRIGSLDADGFTFENTSAGSLNASGGSYASWLWKAGGAAVSNTDGSITSQVSANVDAGFSIVSYTGTGSAATIGHGLSSAPSLVLTKSRSNDTGDGFIAYHSGLPSASYWLDLSSTGAQSGPNSVVWNGTAPTSSVFSVGTASGTNTSGYTYIAYCFANKEGYLKAGSYTGNGSSDGPFVYTGFRPAWVMTKRTETTSSWSIIDVERSSFNEMNDTLFPDLSNAENAATTYVVDCVSNGFKIRGTNGALNASGGSYIYLAFASSPFKYANAR